MTIHDPRTWGMVATGGGNGLGAAYMRGYWDTPDLTELLRLLARNVDRINRVTAPLDRARQVAGLLRSRRPTRTADRRNIHAHYDLGNSFFELFLDPTMAYSCAIFEPGDDDLEAASRAQVRPRLRPAAADRRAIICWRSAPAGAGSPSTPPGGTAAGSPPPPSRGSSATTRGLGSPPPASPTA